MEIALQLLTVSLLLVSLSLAGAGCARQSITPALQTDAQGGWAYWLQNPNLEVLAATDCAIVVIDYAAGARVGETGEGAPFTREDLAVLQGKTRLAYLSIGEAEEYRFYWKPAWKAQPPAFLGQENPDWPGNYKVRYWEEAWWEDVLEPYLDRILEAGFDGVYLDIIDAYWFWSEQGRDLTQAADEMVVLVNRIALYLEAKSGRNKIVCPQNGLSLLQDASPKAARRFLRVADMFAVESLFYNIYSEDDQANRMALVRQVLAAGKPVLSVEYIAPEEVPSYVRKAAAFPGLLPCAAAAHAQLDGLMAPCLQPKP